MEATVGRGLTRRETIVAAALLGAASAFPMLRLVASPSLAGGWEAGARPAPAKPEPLTLAQFTPHVGSRFAVRAPGWRAFQVTLEEATATRSEPAAEAFSLLFRRPVGPAAGDGIHTLVHPSLGEFQLFLVAVGRGANGQEYQAVVDGRVAPSR